MKNELISLINQANPWLKNSLPIVSEDYMVRFQADKLFLSEWDSLWLILIGPRQAGKTTLAKYVAQKLIQQKRFENLVYLNCDLLAIRRWLTSPLFLDELMTEFGLTRPIILIDEVQRLENPGLLLKSCADLKLNIKMMATGSSQLEIKSKVQEFLTGRQFVNLVLPFSYAELEFAFKKINESQLVYGCYPAVVKSTEKALLLRQIYQDYVNKDIVEILQVGKPDVMQKLLTLLAHSSGQLVNYNQLAMDCGISVVTIKNYLAILENTFLISRVTPFVGNKRKEITSNPIFYFIDNGFRNQALHNLSIHLDTRQDVGLLVQSAVFQELLKFKTQNLYDFAIHFWRTQSGAEVDFVLAQADQIIPVEVKFRSMDVATVSRSFRSFVEAYQPKIGFFITKDLNQIVQIDQCKIHFIAFSRMTQMIKLLQQVWGIER